MKNHIQAKLYNLMLTDIKAKADRLIFEWEIENVLKNKTALQIKNKLREVLYNDGEPDKLKTVYDYMLKLIRQPNVT